MSGAAEQPAFATPAEGLLSQFYDWEREGRGWQMYDVPVRPEPGFRYFGGHSAGVLRTADDGRHHTIRSWIAEGIGNLFSPKPARQTQPVPPRQGEPREAPEIEWVEFRIRLPGESKVEIEDFEQFLVAAGSCLKPLCFELIGTGEAVVMRLAVDEDDADAVASLLEAYIPEAVISGEGFDVLEDDVMDQAEVVECGLANEFMLPLATYRDLASDPYVALVAALAAVQVGELGALQVMFEPVSHPWSASAWRAVTFSDGSAFFDDAPGFLPQVKRKVARPLFAAVVRIAAASDRKDRTSRILRSLAGALGFVTNPDGNSLIPLANLDERYTDREHVDDLYLRRSRRTGMIISSEELATLVHLPTEEVQSAKVERLRQRSKAAPASSRGHELLLGTNVHNGRESIVTMSADQRVRHTHVIGASGTGKSTFLLNLILQDIESGQGIGVIDPHGDLIDHILSHIPESRFKDVILVDPSDEDYPIGFNILSAHSDLEKNLLASDLVAVFKRFSESWGDQMGSVLSNAVLAILESSRGGTLADLRRFLIEPTFRTEFLSTVTDDHVLYYWTKEFKLLSGRPQAPLLTRLDTFLRPKPLRYMVSQRENRLDFAHIMDTGKIFLAKLAQGAIGEENASLLGSLFVSKFHQLALSRQSQTEHARRYFWLYCDEFGGYVTPSMAKLLSGARKFRLGLTLSHQELQQIHDADVQSAIIANAGTRICFRVGDKDATTLADGFSFFEAADLRNLGTGQAICRISRAEDDFNLTTQMIEEPDPDTATNRRMAIQAYTRATYATKRSDVESMMAADRGEATTARKPPEPAKPVELKKTGTPSVPPPVVEKKSEELAAVDVVRIPPVQTPVTKQRKPKAVPGKVAPMGKGGARHKYLQHRITLCGQDFGWRAMIEAPTGNGAESVDVVLERENRRIAFEISVTTSVDMELGNLRKCLTAGFVEIYMVCDTPKTLAGLQVAAAKAFTAEELSRVRLVNPEELFGDQKILAEATLPQEQMINGYKVMVSRGVAAGMEGEARRRVIAEILARAMKKQ